MVRSQGLAQIIASARGFLRLIRGLLLLAADTFVLVAVRQRRKPTTLLVRLDAIGDFILWTDAAQAIAAYYRQAGTRVVLIANQAWADWATQLCFFDDVVAVDTHRFRTRFRYRLHVGAAVRRLGSSTAVNATYSRIWLADDAILRLSAATERIASVGDRSNSKAWQMRLSNHWYTRLIPASATKMTELERNAEFVRGLCDADFPVRIPRLEASGQTAPDPAFLAETCGEPYYVLFPGAGWKGREWPAARFVEFAKRLHEQTGWTGVICGGAAETKTAEGMCADATVRILNWAGRSTLQQFANIIAHARFVLTNETSAVHFAAVFGVPAVCILGGGHFGRFLPYRVDVPSSGVLPVVVSDAMPCFGCNWQCIFAHPSSGPVPCIERIQVDAVWGRTAELLGLPLRPELIPLRTGKP